MKKVIAFCLTAAMAFSLIAGCQATPDKPVVVQKDLEQMIEKATEEDETQQDTSLAACINTPKKYTTSFDGYNGDLIVNVNAAVTVPESDGISVARIGKHEFTQGEADRLMEVFLQGETLYQVDLSMTREEIQEKLLTYYGMRDGSIPIDMDGENPQDKEKLQQTIEYYEKLLKEAPETKELCPANTTFHAPDTLINPDAQVIEGTATVNEKASYFYVNNGFFSENNIETVFINAKMHLEGNYSACPYSVLSDGELKDIQIPDSFKMSRTDAQNAAGEVLTKLGITDMTCVSIQYAVMPEEVATGTVVAEPEAVITPQQLETGKWAYCLQYQRSINGIPITLTSHNGTHHEEEGDVSMPWPYEKLEMIVDETGIVYYYYRSPYSALETITEDAALKQFSEIESVFEKMFPIIYGHLDEEGTDYMLKVDITEVELGLIRITEQNSRDTALLIPVWDFFGDVTIIPYEGDPYQFSDNDSLITINAIDGSIIDRNLGY